MSTRDLLRDWWLPVALVAMAVAETTQAYADHPAGPGGLLTVLVPMALLLGLRRPAAPTVAVGETVLTAVLVLAVQPSPAEQPPLTPFLCLLVTLFHLGLRATGRTLVAVGGGVGLALAALQVVSLAAGQPTGDVLPSTVFLGGAFVVGRILHGQRRAVVAERSRAEQAELTRERHAREAADAERARIARELHDVVAHALTGIVVQASVEARLHDEAERSDAVAALRAIERQGRDAMVELRRLLGLLREEGQGPASGPVPSLGGLDDLIARLEAGGHRVELTRVGDLDHVPAGIGLAAYRILQEAVTNTARHAPGSAVRITVGRTSSSLLLRVENDAAARPVGELTSGGYGLPGLHERVRLFEGRITAGPTEGGGFTLEAELPLPVAGGTR